jgi:hypothetical protein
MFVSTQKPEIHDSAQKDERFASAQKPERLDSASKVDQKPKKGCPEMILHSLNLFTSSFLNSNL